MMDIKKRIYTQSNFTNTSYSMAGETRFEHATYGFGDRYSTVEPLPFAPSIILKKTVLVNYFGAIGKNYLL